MNELLAKLKHEKDRSGSKARCHLLTHGDRATVAERLTALTGGVGAINADDYWMPSGFDEQTEAQLHQCPRLFPESFTGCDAMRDWWITIRRGKQTLPSFDIASQCTITGRQGLLLVEAKAYHAELSNEEKGKSLKEDSSDDSFANHCRIGQAIADASANLQRATGWNWAVSRDSRYQLSNRFAWAWKVASLGVPVVLVYLGFLDAHEMTKPFTDRNEWRNAVLQHASGFVPARAWKEPINVNGTSIHALIQSMQLNLNGSMA